MAGATLDSEHFLPRIAAMLAPPKLRLLDQPVTVSLENPVPGARCYRHHNAKLELSFVHA